MPWGLAAAVAGPVIGGVVSSAMSPSTSGGGPNYYTPTGLGQADQNWQDLNNYLTQVYGANRDPMAQLAQRSLYGGVSAGDMYGPGMQAGADLAGSYSTNLGASLDRQASQNFGTQQALLNAGQQVYGMGLDPQQALYNRTLGQVRDQTGATNSMYGLGSSGAGAGVANQALSNFNIDWQNQQLQRALQGLQGYNQAAQTGGAYGQLGTGQASAVPGLLQQGGQLPYQAAQTIAANPGQLASTYGQFTNANIYGPAQAIQAQTIPYMNYGSGAQALPYQMQTAGAGALGSGISQGVTSALNGMGNPWASSNPFGGSSGWSDYGGFGGTSPVTGLTGGGGNYSIPSYGFYG